MPGFMRRHVDFWHDIILKEHPLRDTLVLYLRDGVGLHDLLLREYRGPSSVYLFDVGRFPGAVFQNRIPPIVTSIVDDEVRALVDRGCVVKWANIRAPGGPQWPRLGMAMSVEQTKTAPNGRREAVQQAVQEGPFSMDTVARVANVASQGCYMTLPDDSSVFHHILLRPFSWPRFGFSYGGIDYCWCVLPFGFSLSPWCYHTPSEAKAAYLRSKGIPAIAFTTTTGG